MTALRQRRTRIVASFFSRDGFSGEVNESHPDFGSIVGFQFGKQFGPPSGTWTLRVRSPLNLHELWRDPENVVALFQAEIGGVRQDITFGFVDSVTENMQRTGDGARHVEWTITGRDAGKPFEHTELYVNIYEQGGALPVIPLYTAMQEHLEGRPDEIVRAIIRAWLGNNGVADKQWELPPLFGMRNRPSFWELLHLNFHETRGRVYDMQLVNPDTWDGHSLWDALQEWQNGLLNEMWIDFRRPDRGTSHYPLSNPMLTRPAGAVATITDSAVTLTLRERPFPTYDSGRRRWNALPTHELRLGDVAARQVVKGNPQSRFNFWSIAGQGAQGDGMETRGYIAEASHRDFGRPGAVPVYDVESIRHHGFRRWEQRTRYFPFRDDPQWLLLSARWLQTVHDWYVMAPLQLSGTIVTGYLRADVKIGDRVIEERYDGSKVVYYVEGVQHDYTYPQAGRTIITVTRGEDVKTNLLTMYYDKLLSAETTIEDAISRQRMTIPRTADDADPETVLEATEGAPSDAVEDAVESTEDADDSQDMGTFDPTDMPDQQTTPEQESTVRAEEDVFAGDADGTFDPTDLERGANLPEGEGEAREPSDTPHDERPRARRRGRSRTRASGDTINNMGTRPRRGGRKR